MKQAADASSMILCDLTKMFAGATARKDATTFEQI
jgi:hypothetical protein